MSIDEVHHGDGEVEEEFTDPGFPTSTAPAGPTSTRRPPSEPNVKLPCSLASPSSAPSWRSGHMPLPTSAATTSAECRTRPCLHGYRHLPRHDRHRHRRDPLGQDADARPRDGRRTPPAAIVRRARAGAIEILKEGAKDSGIGVGRRGLLKGSLVTALAIAPLSVLVPAIGNLGGDWNVSKLRHTMWRKGLRLPRTLTAPSSRRPTSPLAPSSTSSPTASTTSKTQARREGEGGRPAHPDRIPRISRSSRPRGLVLRRHHRVLQDLHPRGLPRRAVRAADAPPAVPVPPVDVRRRRRRQGDLRPGQAAAAPVAHRRGRRGLHHRQGRLQRADRPELLGAPQVTEVKYCPLRQPPQSRCRRHRQLR